MSAQVPPTYLIRTKLNQPRIAAQLIKRKRLYTPLDLHCPLSVVVAPAGYGKTMLLSSWSAQCGQRCAWLSLDAADDQLSAFVDYFLAAVELLFPEVVHKIAVGPNHGTGASFEAVARKLADELDAIDESFVLILDDYHYITEPAIHRFLTEILRFPPRSLNLVIASRTDPPLPLAAMRARAHLAEIRTNDLRFSIDEVAEYLRQELDQTVDDKTLTALEQSTQGWVTGLQLAALFLRDQKDTAAAAVQFQVSSRFTVDYLALEVLAKQGPAIQTFLLRTSILQRLCPELCNALLAADPAAHEGRQILDHLDRHNLFLMTLDDNQQWYGYHPLFQELLQSQLRATCSADEIADLYARASRWCAERNLVGEAVAYALAAADIAGAITLIEQHRHQAMNAEQWQRLERWLHLIDRRYIETSPQLLVLEAWILHKRQHLSAVPGRLDLADALLNDNMLPEVVCRRLRSEIDALRSQLYFRQADGERTVHSASRALEVAPQDYASVRGLAWFFLAAGCFLNKGLQAALESLPVGVDDAATLGVAVVGRILTIRCFLYWMAADMPSLKIRADELLSFAERHKLPESIVWAHYFRGCAYYQQNDLGKAGEDFLAVVSSQHVAPGFALIEGTFGLAALLQAQGNLAGAQAAAESVQIYAQQTDNDTAREAAKAFQAYLVMLQDRSTRASTEALIKALSWAEEAAGRSRFAPLVTFFAPPLGAAAILIRHGAPASLAKAERMLNRADAFLSTTHIDRFRIEVLALQSLLYSAHGQETEALATIESAITMAEPGRLMRVFLDAGPALAELLGRLKLTGERGAFVARIRQEFKRSGSQGPATDQAAHQLSSTPTVVQPRHPDLIELLTHRELEVLQLLALRLSNLEIARELSISTGTVKQHTINIFRKLHATNRREAIVQAQTMGFKVQTVYPF